MMLLITASKRDVLLPAIAGLVPGRAGGDSTNRVTSTRAP
jgi:hypothetical protein